MDSFAAFRTSKNACAKKRAATAYSFIEPSFLLDPNDAHPPHDVESGGAISLPYLEGRKYLKGME